MGARTDTGLALIALAAFLGAFVLTDSTLSIPALVVGGGGTIAFEIVAFRHFETVRRVWERPAVQLGTLAVAIAIAATGAIVAPAIVLSAGIGTLVTYLAVLLLVLSGTIEPGS